MECSIKVKKSHTTLAFIVVKTHSILVHRLQQAYKLIGSFHALAAQQQVNWLNAGLAVDWSAQRQQKRLTWLSSPATASLPLSRELQQRLLTWPLTRRWIIYVGLHSHWQIVTHWCLCQDTELITGIVRTAACMGAGNLRYWTQKGSAFVIRKFLKSLSLHFKTIAIGNDLECH